jgi:transglutaminase-like putative cysteine protease
VSTEPVTYDVIHTTRYTYGEPVSQAQHVARLAPRSLAGQQPLGHELDVEPLPDTRATHVDYFGNTTAFFAIGAPHMELVVRARSRVAVHPAFVPVASDTPPWEAAADRSGLPLEVVEFVFDTVSTQPTDEIAAYSRLSFAPGRPLLEAVLDLTGRIHRDLVFDPKATTIQTPLLEVFRSRRGVCQDFARLEIACLRAVGLPARYVSGYLDTEPPVGQPRLVGADASHAWLAVHCPGAGWIDVDPTNNLLPSQRHVTLAWGRDYGDISPLHGVILGGGQHSLKVSVDVIRVEP